MRASLLSLVLAAVVAVPASLPGQPADSSRVNSVEVRRKSALLATLLGYAVPGGGHYYAGEHGRGALITVGTGVAFLGGYVAADQGEGYGSALLVAAFGTYAFGIWDAHRAVRRRNARAAAAFHSLRLRPVSFAGQTFRDSPRPGVAFVLRW